MSTNKSTLPRTVMALAVAVFLATSSIAQQPPMPASPTTPSVDDLMAAARNASPAAGQPAPPQMPNVLGGSLPIGMGGSAPTSPVSTAKKGSFLVATFVSSTGAIAEFQVDGAPSYYSLNDRLKDGWVVRNITTNSVVMEQCKNGAKCKSKTIGLEVN
jgi:hypothetical protein